MVSTSEPDPKASASPWFTWLVLPAVVLVVAVLVGRSSRQRKPKVDKHGG